MDRRRVGISPVVATVILVAVAIVIAIAVAFWASGLVGVFTRFEKIEIQSAYPDTQQQVVVVIAKNTGSSPAVIDRVFINGRPDDRIQRCQINVQGGAPPPGGNGLVALDVGDQAIFNVPFACVTTGGVTNEIALHTTSGKTYPVAVLVP